jgi:WD repeat-containing protein 48
LSDPATQMQAAKPHSVSTVISSTRMIPAIAPSPTRSTAPTARSSPLLAPLIPIHPVSKDAVPLPSIPHSPLGSHDATPMPRHARAQTADSGTQSSSAPATSKDDYFSMRVRQSSAGVSIPDDFAGLSGSGKPDSTVPPTPLTPGAGLMGRLKSFSGKVSARKGSADVVPPSPTMGPALLSEAKAEVGLLSCLYATTVLIICCHRAGALHRQRGLGHLNKFFCRVFLRRHRPAKHPTSPLLQI